MPVHFMELFCHEEYLIEVILRDCFVVVTLTTRVKFKSQF